MIFKFKQRTRPTNDELLADIRRVAKKLKKNCITIAEYHRYGIARISLFRWRFGTWNNALKTAGLEPSRNESLSNDELMENMRDVWVKLGRQPIGSDMRRPLSRATEQTYRARFGSWNAAMEAFEKWLKSPKAKKRKRKNHTAKLPDKPIRHRTQRAVPYQLRYKVLQRDGHRCRSCGRSPANESGVKLHIDHIKPWSKGGETTLDNLQVLCEKCNYGKSNH